MYLPRLLLLLLAASRFSGFVYEKLVGKGAGAGRAGRRRQAGQAGEAARGCSGRVKQKARPERGLIAKVRWKQLGE